MNRFARIFAALLAIGMVALTGCSNNTAAPSQGGTGEPQKKVLRVGMEGAYAPFNWTQLDDSNGAVRLSDKSGYVGGYDIEIAKRIAEGLDMELEMVKMDWEGLVPGITSGKIDLIIAGMSPTAERMETIDFTDVYYESDLVVVVAKDSPYANATSLSDLSGAKITGQLSTFHYSVISQIPNVSQQPAMDNFPTMTIAVASGKIDGYVSERPGAMSAISSNPNLTFIQFNEGQGFQASAEDTAIAVGLKKGSELTASINEVLKGISREQRIELMDQAIQNQPLAE